MEKDKLKILQNIFGRDNVLDGEEDRVCYSYDGTPMKSHLPDVIVLAENVEQISNLMEFANEHKIPVVPRGSGTGLSGGAIPVKGGVCLVLTGLNKILEIDEENLTATVQPGVITAELHKAVESKGLFYPPDPGSMKISTIGGNVAENAGGLRGLKYGITEDYVMGLTAVLPTGEILKMGTKCVKDAAGYNLKKFFVGSEGTIGIITEILLKLIPVPETKKTMTVHFRAMEDAASAVSSIIAEKIIPATLEFLDSTTIKCVEAFAKIGLPLDIGALLLIELDGAQSGVDKDTDTVINICRNMNALKVEVAGNPDDVIKLTEARRSALAALARQRPTTILEDVTVPRSNLSEMIVFIEKTAKKYNLTMGTFGHAGDGNIHPTCLTDERDEEEIHRIEQAYDEIYKKAISLGGTITGEHGVGLQKSDYLPLLIGETGMEVMKKIKTVLDPNNVLNPNKIFPV